MWALDVVRNIRPKPPVANITARRAEDVQLTVRDAVCDDAAGLAALDEHVDHVVLVEEPDAVLDALLIQRLEDHVPGAVGREA